MRGAVIVLSAAACLAACSDPEERVASCDQVAARGKILYARHGCAVCHGPDGRGDGPVGRSMKQKPRDFRDVNAFRNGRSLGAISETIRLGVAHRGVGMPAYPHLPEEERRTLAAYVVSIHEMD